MATHLTAQVIGKMERILMGDGLALLVAVLSAGFFGVLLMKGLEYVSDKHNALMRNRLITRGITDNDVQLMSKALNISPNEVNDFALRELYIILAKQGRLDSTISNN